MQEALAAAATRYVHGYFDRRGRTTHFEVSVEDAATHKMTATLALDGSVLSAMESLAKSIDPGAHAFSTANPEALEAWGQQDFERAVTLDPDFGAAWMGWAQKLVAGNDSAKAREVAARGLARRPLRSNLDRAQLRLLQATLANDPAARREALGDLWRMAPADTTLGAAAAEAEMMARNFAAAVRLYGELLRVDPNNAAVINGLGYAYGFAGDIASARKTFAEYARFRDQEANAFDSMGEVLFLNGQFQEAEKQFLDAHEKNPRMLSGADLAKAAYARWMAGDLQGADGIFNGFVAFRTKAGDATVLWRKACWLYATGRAQQAVETLTPEATSEAKRSAALADLASKQLVVWKNPALPSDLAALRTAYERTPPASDGVIRIAMAEALLAQGETQAGNRTEASKLLRYWPLPEQVNEPLLQSLVYPRFKELKGKIK